MIVTSVTVTSVTVTVHLIDTIAIFYDVNWAVGPSNSGALH
jgi:hypothetical protein